MIKPLSREILLERGNCCNNGCKNCPYQKQSQVIESCYEWVDSDNDEYDGYSSKASDGEESGYDDDSDDD